MCASNQTIQTAGEAGSKLKTILAVLTATAGIVGFYFLSSQTKLVRAAVLITSLVAALALAWTSTQGREFINFAKEAVRETKKIVWPTYKEAMQITTIVFIFVVLMATFLWGIDKCLEFLLYNIILGWKQ